MILRVDAQLSPALAPWIASTFGIEAFSVRHLGLRDVSDGEIHRAARDSGAVVMTKDRDFVQLIARHGPPPSVVWARLGNTSNARMREVLSRHLPQVADLLSSGETLVEIRDA